MGREQQEEEHQYEEEHRVEQLQQQEEQLQVVVIERVIKVFGRYVAIEYIGDGKCVEVYKCIDRCSGKKVIFESYPTIEENNVFATTYFRLQSINKHNPNVARFIEKYQLRSTRGLVFEYIVGTDMKKFITISNLSTNPLMIKKFLLQMLLGVVFCHQYGIYHQDLKPENFMVEFNVKQLKLTNFGLARVSDNYFSYRAPELLLGASFENSKVADMWSIGCIFAEMLTNSPLFIAEMLTNSPLFIAEIKRDQLISIFSLLGTPNEETWSGITPYLLNFDMDDTDFKPQNLAAKFTMLNANGVDLLSKMLTLDPKQRITAIEACRHNYFFEP